VLSFQSFVYRNCCFFRSISEISIQNSDLANWTWLLTAILDIQGGCTWTTPHVAVPHFLRTHQICWRSLFGAGDMPSQRNSKKRPLVVEFYLWFQGWRPLSLADLCRNSCKISAKSDSRRPSYCDFTNSRWPPSAILDIWSGRTWSIPHVVGAHFLLPHQIAWRYLDRRRGYAPKLSLTKCPVVVEFYFWFQGWRSLSFQDLNMCHRAKISAKSDDQRPSYSDLTMLPFGAHFEAPFLPTDLRVGEAHPHPVGTVW